MVDKSKFNNLIGNNRSFTSNVKNLYPSQSRTKSSPAISSADIFIENVFYVAKKEESELEGLAEENLQKEVKKIINDEAIDLEKLKPNLSRVIQLEAKWIEEMSKQTDLAESDIKIVIPAKKRGLEILEKISKGNPDPKMFKALLDKEILILEIEKGKLDKEKDKDRISFISNSLVELKNAEGYYVEYLDFIEDVELRAKYNLTNDPSVFNKLLPYRSSIRDEKKLKEYDELVKFFMDKSDIRFTNEAFDREKATIEGLREADKSLKYLVSASFVDMLHQREDQIKKLISFKNGLKVLFGREFVNLRGLGNTMGAYSPSQHTMYFKTKGIHLKTLTRTLKHEGIHAFDNMDGDCDGILKDMDEDSKNDFLSERKQLNNKFDEVAKKSGLPKEILIALEPHDLAVGIGLPHYAFANDKEFLAVITEMYFRNPEDLKRASNKLFTSLDKYFSPSKNKDK